MLNIFKKPKKSKWIDICVYDSSGRYKLVQMRYRIDNNKKEFRTCSLGFVNDHLAKLDVHKNVFSNNTETKPE